MADETPGRATVLGIPRIIHARSIIGRIFWSVICVLAFLVFCPHVIQLFLKYFAYPVKVEMRHVDSSQFPAVTVCSKKHIDWMVEVRIRRWLSEKGYNHTQPGDSQGLMDFFKKYNLYQEEAGNFFPNYATNYERDSSRHIAKVYSRYGLIANLGAETVSSAGVQLADFVVNCKFMKKSCNMTNAFVKYFDSSYYNCYTFKADPESADVRGPDKGSESVDVRGADKGLSLILFTGGSAKFSWEPGYTYVIPGLDNYDLSGSSSNGIRAVVHEPEMEPPLTSGGFDVLAGAAMSAKVKVERNKRLAAPFGDCQNNQNSYSVASCHDQCQQEYTRRTCGCTDARTNVDDPTTSLNCEKLPDASKQCQDGDNEQCKKVQQQWHAKMKCLSAPKDTKGKCACPRPCKESVYSTTLMSSEMSAKGSDRFHMLILTFLDSLPAQKKDILIRSLQNSSSENTDDKEKPVVIIEKIPVKENFLTLNVYLSTSDPLEFSQYAAYPLVQLFCDLWVQVGIFLALVTLSLGELLQLLVNLCSCLACKKKDQDKTPVPQEDDITA